jgi:peptidoglycan hydrolase CwlO-like protein
MKGISKIELALAGLKSNRNQLQNQLSDLDSELVYCYLPGEMKDRLCTSLEEAIEILDEEIDNLEYDITQLLDQG